jgi:hypothetical protein
MVVVVAREDGYHPVHDNLSVESTPKPVRPAARRANRENDAFLADARDGGKAPIRA